MTDPANMALRARELLGAQGAEARVDTLKAARRRVVEIERDLARAEQRITWWERVVFFHQTPDEAKVKKLRAARDEARAASDAAKTAWVEAVAACAGYAPIDVVFQIESIIDDVMMDPEVGRVPKANKKVAAALERVVARVRELWLPGLDLAAIVARLSDDEARRHAAGAPAGPLTRDAALGFAPLGEDELFRRVAYAVETSGAFASARATLSRELQETESWMVHLENARAQVKWHDVLIPGTGERERTVLSLEAEVARELMESAHALDELRLTVLRAFAAHPIAWLYFALLGATAALRAAKPRQLATLAADADVETVASGAARAVVLASLVEVRRACEVAFAGVPRQVWPRGRHESAPVPAADSPYRLAGRVVDQQIVVDLAEEELAFFHHLEGCHVRQALGQAVAVATVYGLASLDLARLDIAWLDRLAVWSDTPEEEERDRLEARIDAYHQSLAHYGDYAVATVGQEALGHHAMVGLGHSLAAANVDAAKIRTNGGSSSSPMHCPTLNKGEAIASVDAVVGVMSRFFAVRGDRGTWIDDVCRRLWRAEAPITAPAPDGITSYEQIVELLAARLYGSDFVPLVQRVLELRQQHSQATQAVQEVSARVSFWDKLNFFSDTPDETLRDQWREHAAKLHQDLAGSEAEVHRLLDGALAAYPPMVLYEQLANVLGLLRAIHARSERRTRTHTTRDSQGRVTSTRTEVYYVCVIYGVSAAQDALSSVTKNILDTFGPLPTPSDALEAWIAQEL